MAIARPAAASSAPLTHRVAFEIRRGSALPTVAASPKPGAAAKHSAEAPIPASAMQGSAVVAEGPLALLDAYRGVRRRVAEATPEPRKDPDDFGHGRLTRHAWGARTVLHEASGFRIERLEINPGSELAPSILQRHWIHWVITEGAASMIIGADTYEAGPNESHYVPVGTWHQLLNPGRTPLVVLRLLCGGGANQGVLSDEELDALT